MLDFFANLDYAVYTLALLTGFFGSGHCAGMCGALVAGFFMKSEKKSAWPYIAYHFGRLSMYTVVGIIAALIGVCLELFRSHSFSWVTLLICLAYPPYFILRRKIKVSTKSNFVAENISFCFLGCSI